jgi:hypothetical protein
MCACVVFLIVAVLAAFVYTLMHAMWLAAAAVVVVAIGIALFGKKAAQARKSGH